MNSSQISCTCKVYELSQYCLPLNQLIQFYHTENFTSTARLADIKVAQCDFYVRSLHICIFLCLENPRYWFYIKSTSLGNNYKPCTNSDMILTMPTLIP